MNTGGKIAVVGIAAIVLGVGAFLLLKKKKPAVGGSGTGSITPDPALAISAAAAAAIAAPSPTTPTAKKKSSALKTGLTIAGIIGVGALASSLLLHGKTKEEQAKVSKGIPITSTGVPSKFVA
jgi:hypothetical protein